MRGSELGKDNEGGFEIYEKVKCQDDRTWGLTTYGA